MKWVTIFSDQGRNDLCCLENCSPSWHLRCCCPSCGCWRTCPRAKRPTRCCDQRYELAESTLASGEIGFNRVFTYLYIYCLTMWEYYTDVRYMWNDAAYCLTGPHSTCAIISKQKGEPNDTDNINGDWTNVLRSTSACMLVCIVPYVAKFNIMEGCDSSNGTALALCSNCKTTSC